MCRDRVHGALRAVEAILNQSTSDFLFLVSDNSVSLQVSERISALYPHILVKQRGGHLTQFEHMSTIINEASSDYLLITHDDDFLSHNFVTTLYSILSKIQEFGVLLNTVLRFDEFATGTREPNRVDQGSDYLEKYSLDSVIQDYLIGCYCNEIYSVSMTVFNTKLARSCLETIVGSGDLADACFLIKMCSLGRVFVNKTPVGVYQMSSDSVSNSLSLRDSKLFLRFLYSEEYSGRFSREIRFFKLRTRFYYSKFARYDSSYRVRLLLSILYFVANPLSLRVISSFIVRKVRCFAT